MERVGKAPLRCRKASLHLDPKKSEFYQKSVKYLEYIIVAG